MTFRLDFPDLFVQAQHDLLSGLLNSVQSYLEEPLTPTPESRKMNFFFVGMGL